MSAYLQTQKLLEIVKGTQKRPAYNASDKNCTKKQEMWDEYKAKASSLLKMDTKTWTVVQFTDDLTVEAIPSTWIQGNDCHWPPFSREKLYNAIRKSEPLNTCWPMHKIKIFRSATYGEHLKARNKARVAESVSDINSEPDIESKRKRTPKILSSSDDSEDDSILPPPPQISKFKQNKISKFKQMHIRPGNGVHQATEKVLENINDENLKPEEVDGSSIDNEVQLLQDK
ncbi:hypothetical protein FQA39_LY17272 [Lamprigera yunnana]|nr:hypothetical protein FQA39_LY17272 [Lamprigera yunnana]